MIIFLACSTVVMTFGWGIIVGVTWCDYKLGKALDEINRIEDKYGKINNEPE